MKIIRYRIYQVIKWFSAGLSLMMITLVYIIDYEVLKEDRAMAAVLAGIVWGVLAIFFKLQEDSNKPTVKE